MARHCSQPLTALQAALEWAQHLAQATSRCFNGEEDCHDRRVVWDTLVPRYAPTIVPSLERRRENFAVALAGQLSVFLCRILTGHFGAGGVGLIIFVVGNNARCSLQVSELTCYVALSGFVGCLDVFDLLQHLASGQALLHLPIDLHLAENLQALSLWLAPCAVFMSPEMFFDAQHQLADPRQSRAAQLMFLQQQHFNSMPPRIADPMATRMPAEGDVASMASMMPGWPGWQDVRAFIPGIGQELRHDALASSSQDRPYMAVSKRSPNCVDVACAECGAAIRAGQGRSGTGEFRASSTAATAGRFGHRSDESASR
eukprot:CAMPEP_0181398646 /NCGR_PEP_ID=MMETSP1110-20121109/1157_1 /TAXON_ID=174948 /ORGANISM="Symbiodinium sp., Strain CCMP421" /LENGTH=314 /DNA_ID=CAMNT_0023520621 /DNA_START=8 /DNA_END=949 /DNA_ORIENTATION=-